MYLAVGRFRLSPMMVTSGRINCLRKDVVWPMNPAMTRSWLWVNMVGTMSHFAEKSNSVKKSLIGLMSPWSLVPSMSENSYTKGSISSW